MAAKSVQWSVEETKQLLSIWASPEFQAKLESSTRKDKLYGELVQLMAEAGFSRTKDQLINKLKKVKKEYRDFKRDLSRSGAGRPQNPPPYFEVLDGVLGCRPANQVSGALESRNPPAHEPVAEDSEASTSRTCTGQSSAAEEFNGGEDSFISVDTPRKSRKRKRCDDIQDMIDYFREADSRAEERAAREEERAAREEVRHERLLEQMQRSSTHLFSVLEQLLQFKRSE